MYALEGGTVSGWTAGHDFRMRAAARKRATGVLQLRQLVAPEHQYYKLPLEVARISGERNSVITVKIVSCRPQGMSRIEVDVTQCTCHRGVLVPGKSR